MARSMDAPLQLGEDLQETLREAMASGDGIMVLTGAGVSAESGIPTFRGKEGYWTVGSRNFHPQELATHQAFAALPRDVWHWYLYRRSVCRRAAPNRGHLALVELERALGDRFTLVTQNVDGLHLRAGNTFDQTLQIHGNIDYFRCADRCTDAIHPLPEDTPLLGRDDVLSDDAFERLRCPDCGGPARPHVLWFDEYYDEALFKAQTAITRASAASVLIVAGTSGVTNLPLQIGMLTARRGRPIIDINLEDGPFSELAQRCGGHIVREGASTAMRAVVDVLLRG